METQSVYCLRFCKKKKGKVMIHFFTFLETLRMHYRN